MGHQKPKQGQAQAPEQHKQSERERQPEAPMPGPTQPWFQQQQILLAQRTIGNRQVVRRISSTDRRSPVQASPHARSASIAGSIQRVVDLVPVQVEMDNVGKVSAANIPRQRRPIGVLKGDEGSHSTAWIVIGALISETIVGKTLPEAITAMDELYADTQELPGTDRIYYLPNDVRQMFYDAEEELNKVQKSANTTPTHDILQRYISNFLAYRSLIPFTAVKGAPADSDGETAKLKIIRNYSTSSSKDVHDALIGLLDQKALEILTNTKEDDFYNDTTTTDLPGNFIKQQVSFDTPGAKQDETVEDRVVDVIRQHLKTIAHAFPDAYRHANITVDSILDYFGYRAAESSEEDDYRAADTKKRRQGSKSKPNKKSKKERADIGGDRDTIEKGLKGILPDAPIANPNPIPANQPNVVQITVDIRGIITKANIPTKDRPKGLFGSAEKKHATSYAATVEGVILALEKQNFAGARANLDTLYTTALGLPGVRLTSKLTDEREAAYTAAKTAADTARRNATAKADINTIQQYARAYLAYRNLVPLSAADIPVVGTGGHSEGHYLEIVRHYTSKPSDDVKMALWALLDAGVVKSFGSLTGASRSSNSRSRTDGTQVNPELPGADLTVSAPASEQRIAHVIKQHLKTMQASFRPAFAAANIGTTASVKDYLRDKIGISDASAQTRIASLVIPL